MRFAIRDVLWLTVVVALAVGWWLSVPPSRGRLEGTITVAGKPLSQGRVLFHSLDGQIVGASVAAGKYNIPIAQVGSFAVTVDGSGVAAKYADRTISSLKVDVRDGSNVIDFDLR